MTTENAPQDDDVVDERDLYAPDGGDDPDTNHPHLTQYQAQRLMEFITDAEELYADKTCDEEIDIISSPEAYAASGMDAVEKKIFDFVNLLLAKRDARIAELEGRAAIDSSAESGDK